MKDPFNIGINTPEFEANIAMQRLKIHFHGRTGETRLLNLITDVGSILAQYEPVDITTATDLTMLIRTDENPLLTLSKCGGPGFPYAFLFAWAKRDHKLLLSINVHGFEWVALAAISLSQAGDSVGSINILKNMIDAMKVVKIRSHSKKAGGNPRRKRNPFNAYLELVIASKPNESAKEIFDSVSAAKERFYFNGEDVEIEIHEVAQYHGLAWAAESIDSSYSAAGELPFSTFERLVSRLRLK